MKTVILSLCTILASFSPLSAQDIEITEHPTIGDSQSTVHVVAFLEPKCPDSKRYNNTSFPQLQADYIDSNKIRYSVITTSFLQQSMPAAVALLCAYNQDPKNPRTDLFFKYLDYIYQNQPPESQNWATIDTLLKYAGKASPHIDQTRLKECIENQHYSGRIEKNTAYGNQLMGRLSTPTIYVNGVKVENSDDTIDYDNLKAAIDQALQNKKQ